MMLVEDADARCGLCRLHNGALLILGSLTGALGCRGGFEAALFGTTFPILLIFKSKATSANGCCDQLGANLDGVLGGEFTDGIANTSSSSVTYVAAGSPLWRRIERTGDNHCFGVFNGWTGCGWTF